MDTIFMNSKNSRTSEYHVLVVNLTDKLDLTWSEEFELPDGSYLVSDIQDYFEYILKKNSESVDNPSIIIYVNRIENRITFRIKSGYYLKL